MKTKKKLKLQAESNATLKQVLNNKLELRFPREEGFLRIGRSNFKHEDDLLSYLAQAFPVEKDSFGHRFSIKRTGKYNRLDKSNRIVFTFGDPVLDLITDQNGWVTVGGQRYDLRAAELASLGRGGGIRAVDLSPRPNEFDYVVSRAASDEGNLALIEVGPESAVLASKNPSTIWHYDGPAKMRFRAFKSNYYLGWKMGCDIETWGSDFKRAEIQSAYGFAVFGRVCAVAKRDSDSDTNDDYVDEYEWGTFNTSAPTGVESFCQATWRQKTYSGVVSKGSCDAWI